MLPVGKWRAEGNRKLIKRDIVIGIFAAAALTVQAARPVLSGEISAVRDAPAPETILFLGNSFVQRNNSLHNHLRKLTQSVFTANSEAYYFEAMTTLGARLSLHARTAGDTIKNHQHQKETGPWDLVVLQGQSREPA
jgi:hypothetical protein